MSRESNFKQFIEQTLLPFLAPFPIAYLTGKGGVNIAYRHFTHAKSEPNKLVILVNGRSENIMKWSELAYDFYQLGYDVILFDHRGQGYSQRLINNTEKGYCDNFQYYIDDMHAVINQVIRVYHYEKQYIIAHSLGCLISTFYLSQYGGQIDKAVLCAPFFQLPFKNPILDKLTVKLMILLGQGKRQIPSKKIATSSVRIETMLCSSEARINWMNQINEDNPELKLGYPTFAWIYQCMQAIKKLPATINKIDIPVLILYAENELIVSNQDLQQQAALFKQYKIEKISRAKHEILFEHASIREPTLNKISAFLNNGIFSAN